MSAALFLVALASLANEIPKVGDPAPDFSAIDQDGRIVTRDSLRGKRVVLAFYPKDFTAGCTKEMSGFRDHVAEFRERGVLVYGVSLDASDSHRKFCDSLALSFPLLADVNGRMARAYGIFLDQAGGIARRTIFVVGAKGALEYVDDDYDLKTDDDWHALIAALGPKKGGDAAADAGPLADSAVGDEFRDDLKTLSSDEFEGRGIGTRAERKTVDYLAGELTKAGFSPGNGAAFQQPVPLVSVTKKSPPQLSLGAATLRPLEDFVVFTHRQQPAVEASGELLFVGYGCDAPEYRWDDFKGVDCAGKVLVVLINDPPLADGRFGGKAMTYYGRWTYKFEEAALRKAAGVLIVHETEPAAYPWEVVRNSWGGEQFDVGRDDGGASRCAFEGWITRDAAAALMKGAGQELDALKAAALRDDFQPVALGATAKCAITQTVMPIASRNVAGILPGADPRRSGEFVVLTAHWDHFGVQGGIQGGSEPGVGGAAPKADADQIFNGAVDNASGCAMVLALARTLARGPRPLRSTLVLFVTAEERGLLGSQHYADHPLVPLAKTLANVNVDGANVWGRTRDLAVVGMGQSSLEELLAEAVKVQGRSLVADPEPEKGSFYRSDQLSFVRKGVPALYVKPGIDFLGKPASFGAELRKHYTADLYHKPDDEFDPSWVFDGALEDMQALHAVVRRVLDGDEWPAWRDGSEFKKLRPGTPPAR